MKCNSKDMDTTYRTIGNLHGETKKGNKTFDLRFINKISGLE
jgi:fructose/tagatose bisphosphate aldolase